MASPPPPPPFEAMNRVRELLVLTPVELAGIRLTADIVMGEPCFRLREAITASMLLFGMEPDVAFQIQGECVVSGSVRHWCWVGCGCWVAHQAVHQGCGLCCCLCVRKVPSNIEPECAYQE